MLLLAWLRARHRSASFNSLAAQSRNWQASRYRRGRERIQQRRYGIVSLCVIGCNGLSCRALQFRLDLGMLLTGPFTSGEAIEFIASELKRICLPGCVSRRLLSRAGFGSTLEGVGSQLWHRLLQLHASKVEPDP